MKHLDLFMVSAELLPRFGKRFWFMMDIEYRKRDRAVSFSVALP